MHLLHDLCVLSRCNCGPVYTVYLYRSKGHNSWRASPLLSGFTCLLMMPLLYVQLNIFVNLQCILTLYHNMCVQSSFISLVIALGEILCSKSVTILSFLVGIALLIDNWLLWARLYFVPWQFMFFLGWRVLEETILSVQRWNHFLLNNLTFSNLVLLCWMCFQSSYGESLSSCGIGWLLVHLAAKIGMTQQQ